MSQRFVVVDIETTGNVPINGDRIIQFAAVVIENGEICERFSSFINPNRPIPPFIENLTGISNDFVGLAPEFKLIAPEIVEMLKGAYFVAHNVPFDLSFLQVELENNGFPTFTGPTIDTVELSRIMMPWFESYKLSFLAESLSLSHIQPHRADSDAEVTAELLVEILRRIEGLPLVTCQKILKLSKGLKSDLYEILDKVIQRKSHKLREDDEAFDIHRGIALKKHTVELIKNGDWNYDFQQIKNALIGENNLRGEFEYRIGQQRMMDFIHEVQELNQHGIVEGGTGIGKSLGYLIPSLYFSVKNKERVVISTNTIQLQQQLLENDIPICKAILPFSFRYSLLKGKSHYLSLRKFEQSLYELDDNYDTTLAKCQILVWLTETETGDVEEINLPSGGRLYWNTINMDSSANMTKEDPWHEWCFYKRSKQNAENSELIITNHSLLFSDLTNPHQLIPEFEYLVIDEAHHLEKAASTHFGNRIDYIKIHGLLTQMGSLEHNDILAKVNKIFSSVGIEKNLVVNVDEQLKNLKVSVDELFRMIHSYVVEEVDRDTDEQNRVSYYLKTEQESNVKWQGIVEILDSILIQKAELLKIAQQQNKLMNQSYHMITPLQYAIVSDYFSLIFKLKEQIDTLESLISQTHKEDVTWIEANLKGAKNATAIYSQPIDVSTLLADRLFTKKKSVVLTSATLTVNNSFDYTIKNVGLSDFQPKTLKIETPFDMRKQAVLLLPTDIPDVSEHYFIPTLVDHIVRIAQVTKGRMLILFTSYDMLKNSYKLLKGKQQLEEFMILGQGISGGSKVKLTKNFKAFEKAILLGTNSFWEGVDIPGEKLSALVIVRLPFTNPNDPVFSAKENQLRIQGGNPFYELSLPEAIMRFKQGFGRLIRSKHDKGIVFVMDRRISTTSYGKNFLLSIPNVSYYEDPLPSLLKKVKDWL